MLGRLGAWAVWAVALGAGAGHAAPPPVGQVVACVEDELERLRSYVASEAGMALRTAANAAPTGGAISVAVLGVRASAGGSAVALAWGDEVPALGRTGTFGGQRFEVRELGRGYGVAQVAAPPEALAAFGRVALLDAVAVAATPAGDVPFGGASFVVSPEATVAAVEAVNAAGGIPWLRYANDNRTSWIARMAAERAPEGLGWAPRKKPDDFLRFATALVLDLEKNGSRYVNFAVPESPVSDLSLLMQPRGKGWALAAEVPGTLGRIAVGEGGAAAGEGTIDLAYDGLTDQSRITFEPGRRRFAARCILNEAPVVVAPIEVVAGAWEELARAPEAAQLKTGVRRVALARGREAAPGEAAVEAPTATWVRGEPAWWLLTVGRRAFVAVLADAGRRDRYVFTPRVARAFQGRALVTGWVDVDALEPRVGVSR